MRTNVYIALLFSTLLIGCATTKIQPGPSLNGERIETASELKKELTAIPVLTALPTPTSTFIAKSVYVVTKGDSLWNISSMVYGDPFLWPSLSAENNIMDPDCISVGTRVFYRKTITTDQASYVDQAKRRGRYSPHICK